MDEYTFVRNSWKTSIEIVKDRGYDIPDEYYQLEEGEKIGIYNPEDYSKNPKMYCGMEINSTPYEF